MPELRIVCRVERGAQLSVTAESDLYLTAISMTDAGQKSRTIDLENSIRGTVITKGQVVELDGVSFQEFRAEISFTDGEGISQESEVVFFVKLSFIQSVRLPE